MAHIVHDTAHRRIATHTAVAEAGGIVPLVGMVTSGNPAGKERAASALFHLCADPKNQLAVAALPPC